MPVRRPPAHHRSAGRPAYGPRYAVRTPGRHHWSPFPVRFDVRNLEPGRDQRLCRRVDDDADNHREAEELAVERGGAAVPDDQEEQRKNLDQVGGYRGHHHDLRAFPGGPGHRDGADAEEDDDKPDPEQGAHQALDATGNGAQHDHGQRRDSSDRGGTPEDHCVTCHLPNSEGSTVGRTASGRAWPFLPWRRPRGPPRRTGGEVRRRVSENVSRAPSLALTWVARERYHKLLDPDFTGSPLVILVTISNYFSTLSNRFRIVIRPCSPGVHSPCARSLSRPRYGHGGEAGGRGGAAGGQGGALCPFPGPSGATAGKPLWPGHGGTGTGPVASGAGSSHGGTDRPAADGGACWSAHGGTAERTSGGSSHGGRDRPAAADGRDPVPEAGAPLSATQEGVEVAGSGDATGPSAAHGGTARASSGGAVSRRSRSRIGADRAALPGGLASSAPHGGTAWLPPRGGSVSSAEPQDRPPGPAAWVTGEPVSSSGVAAGASGPVASPLRPRPWAGAAPLPLAPLPALPLPGAPPFPVAPLAVAPLAARLSASLARMAARAAFPRAVSGTCPPPVPAGCGCSWPAPGSGPAAAGPVGTAPALAAPARAPAGAVPGGAVSAGAGLTAAGLTAAGLTAAGRGRAALTGAALTGVVFAGAVLAGAVLAGAGVAGAGLAGAGFAGAGLAGAGLAGRGAWPPAAPNPAVAHDHGRSRGIVTSSR